MIRLTIAQYLKRQDSYPVSVATIRRYIDTGILKGEKLKVGSTCTYFVHIIEENQDDLIKSMISG